MLNDFPAAMRRNLIPIGLSAALLAGPVTAQQYTIRELPAGAPAYSAAFDLNRVADAVGTIVRPDANVHGVLFDDPLVDLPPLADDLQSHAFAVNDAGQVALVSYDLGEPGASGRLWNGAGFSELGPIAPRGLNASGTVVGFRTTSDPDFGLVDRAARWSAGTLADLGTLGGHFSYAYAVNDEDWIVGMSYTTDDNAHRACLWRGGAPLDLGTLGGGNSQAYDINAAREVVGWAENAAGLPRAFRFTLDAAGAVTSRQDLGALGDRYSYAYATGPTGDVVGTSAGRAVLFRSGAIDLNTRIPADSGWRLDAAWAINERGEIVGVGMHNGQQPRAFLLTPLRTADTNCDGLVNNFDIDPFVLALTEPAAYAAAYPACDIRSADANGDGLVNNFDIDAFVACILAGGCP